MSPQDYLNLTNANQFILMDCGSTTTKALLFSKKDSNWSLDGVVNTPTTVETPNNDVTIGVNIAVNQMIQASGGKFGGLEGVPFLATSSAGGGLQIAVMGLTSEISTSAANQTALNAGAIVSLIGSADDELLFSDRIRHLQAIRPDMIIFAGGLDLARPLAMVDSIAVIKEAKLHPRYGAESKLPLIYCGSSEYVDQVHSELSGLYDVIHIPNLLSDFYKINDAPVKESIQNLFLSTVMHHAPGYSKLCEIVAQPIIPTPMAVTRIIQSLADLQNESILAVDIGGATTDIYTVVNSGSRIVQRSVSANFGMSYSAASVLHKAQINSIVKYCESKATEKEVEIYIWNKTLYPTSVPIDEQSILIEQALCRAALSLSYDAHHEVCGSQLPHGSVFDLCIASGGVLSHAPDIKDVPWIMADGFNLLGVSKIAVDKIFMMPHLGALSEVDKALSTKLLFQECLISICWLVGVTSSKKISTVKSLAKVYLDGNLLVDVTSMSRTIFEVNIKAGQTIRIKPQMNSVNCGAGKGIEFSYTFSTDSSLPLYLDGARC